MADRVPPQPPSIDPKTKVADLLRDFPQTLPVLLKMGFEPLRNPIARRTVAKLFTLEQAAAFRGVPLDTLLGALRRAAGQEDGATSGEPPDEPSPSGEVPELTGDVRVVGLVPCPVRAPLVERFDRGVQRLAATTGTRIAWWLGGEGPATNDVRRWLRRKVEAGAQATLPDVLVAVGTELFFQRQYGALARGDFFAPFPGSPAPHPELAALADPSQRLGLQFAVAFTWSCRPEQLPRGLPRRWSDLAAPELDGQVALPALDLPIIPDLLAALHQHLGEELFARFARNVGTAMHPATAARRGRREGVPAVTILPAHFVEAARQTGAAAVVPEDGAVAVPAYVAVRRGAPAQALEVAGLLLEEEFLRPLWERGGFLPNHRAVAWRAPSPRLVVRTLAALPEDPQEQAERLRALFAVEERR